MTKGTRPVYSYDRRAVAALSRRSGRVGQPGTAPDGKVYAGARHIWIAHVPPYTNQDLAALLGGFRGSRYLKTQVAGTTVERRDIRSADDHESRDRGKPEEGRLADVPPARLGGGFILGCRRRDPLSAFGFRRCRSSSRSDVIFQIFPMADPDGVATGGVRFNKNGYDSESQLGHARRREDAGDRRPARRHHELAGRRASGRSVSLRAQHRDGANTFRRRADFRALATALMAAACGHDHIQSDRAAARRPAARQPRAAG